EPRPLLLGLGADLAGPPPGILPLLCGFRDLSGKVGRARADFVDLPARPFESFTDRCRLFFQLPRLPVEFSACGGSSLRGTATGARFSRDSACGLPRRAR